MKNEWAITTERYVAYFDIMGFKKMLNESTNTKIYNKFVMLINDIRNRVQLHNRIEFTIFSDLIMIISKDKNLKSFNQLVDASLMLIQDTLKKCNWGMNGCISFGSVTYDKEKNIFLGQPIVDAYLMTEDIEFYGVIVYKTAISAVKEYIEAKVKEGAESHWENLFKEERLHFKSGHYSQYHMRWFDYNEVKIFDKQQSNKFYLDMLEKLKNTTFGRGRRYIEYTEDIIGYE